MAAIPVVTDNLRCPFCHRVGKFSYKDIVVLGEEFYKCGFCPREVVFNKKDITIYLHIGNKKYAIEFWSLMSKTTISLVSEEWYWRDTVCEFDFIPEDWNPTNIETKLRTVLTFL